MTSSRGAGGARPARVRVRPIALVAAMIAVFSLVVGCSGDDAAKDADRRSGSPSAAGGSSSGGSGSAASTGEAEQAAAENSPPPGRVKSRWRGGHAGPTTTTVPFWRPDPQWLSADDASGSVAVIAESVADVPSGRRGVDRLQPLDGCGEISAPFCRAVRRHDLAEHDCRRCEGPDDRGRASPGPDRRSGADAAHDGPVSGGRRGPLARLRLRGVPERRQGRARLPRRRLRPLTPRPSGLSSPTVSPVSATRPPGSM